MSIVFAHTMQRLLRDQHARLATVPLQHKARRNEEASMAPLLLVAALYVAARIGLTYAALGH
jgi:hypothetical protein